MLVSMATRKKAAKTPIGCIFWIAFLVVVAVIFVIAKPKIDQVLKDTGFWEAIKPTAAEKTEPSSSLPSSPSAKPSSTGGESVTITVPKDGQTEDETPTKPAPSKSTPSPADKKTSVSPEASASETQNATKSESTGAATAENRSLVVPAAPQQKPVGVRKASLFFVVVDADGSINRQEVKRSVEFTDSPLSDTINALMEGPTAEELKLGYISLIPQGTKLLSATVRGSTAYLDFSENFQFNSMGIEGYAAQLKQVVYTATAFQNVRDVQILIEGEKHQYLGAEGVFIGVPLKRADL
jgi:germination protein M